MSFAIRTAALFFSASALTAFAADSQSSYDLNDLAWMQGHWSGIQDGLDMEEQWTSTKGGALLGIHKDIKNGRMVSFEFFRIDTTKDGTFYFASPRASAPTPFRLVEMGAKRVVFENAEHDFPRRILYWLDDAGALHARIEGAMKGKDVAEEWVWRK